MKNLKKCVKNLKKCVQNLKKCVKNLKKCVKNLKKCVKNLAFFPRRCDNHTQIRPGIKPDVGYGLVYLVGTRWVTIVPAAKPNQTKAARLSELAWLLAQPYY